MTLQWVYRVENTRNKPTIREKIGEHTELKKGYKNISNDFKKIQDNKILITE